MHSINTMHPKCCSAAAISALKWKNKRADNWKFVTFFVSIHKWEATCTRERKKKFSWSDIVRIMRHLSSKSKMNWMKVEYWGMKSLGIFFFFGACIEENATCFFPGFFSFINKHDTYLLFKIYVRWIFSKEYFGKIIYSDSSLSLLKLIWCAKKISHFIQWIFIIN